MKGIDEAKPRRVRTAAARGQKALKELMTISECDANVRLPVFAVSGLLNADMYEYVGEGCRKIIEDLSEEQKKLLTDFDAEPRSMALSGIGGDGLDIRDSKGCVKLLYMGKPDKKEKQLLFMLLCLASNRPELHVVRNVRGPASLVPETSANKVRLSMDSCAVLANFLYGRGGPKSTEMFLSELRKLSRLEFKIKFKTSKDRGLCIETIPFSVATVTGVLDGGKARTLPGIIITLSDLFFYKSHHKYALFNIENMFDGLMGKDGGLVANLISAFATILPTAAMRLKNGKEYKALVPLSQISTIFDTGVKQSRSRAKRCIKGTFGKVSPELLYGRLSILTDDVECAWIPTANNLDNVPQDTA